MDKKILACELVDDAYGQMVFFIRAGKAVKNKDITILKISGDLAVDTVEFFGRDGYVDLAPVDYIVYGGGVYHKTVVGRAAGVFACFDYKRAGAAKTALAALKRFFHEHGGLKIAVNGLRSDYAESLDIFFDLHNNIWTSL